MALERTEIATFPKGPDVVTRVSEVTVGGERLVEFADFIVSKGEYGRGYHFPVEQRTAALQALEKIQ